jgi:glyoxylase-like metal-dependent hydrolase (beta-lactamase superfamily II)
MATFTPWSPHLWVVQHAPYATNSGIFVAGEHALLVDPGLAPDEVREIVRFVRARGLRRLALVITHAHWDHLLGPQHIPDVPVVAHARYGDVVRAHGDDLRRQVAAWGGAPAFTIPRPTHTFTGALTLAAGPLRVRVLHTPGHAPDHCSVYEAEHGALWAGDMLSDREPPLVMDTLDAYAHTLARLAALDVQVLIPGHGAPTADGAEIRARLERDRAYLAALRACVTRAVEAGASLAATRSACAAVGVDMPKGYPDAHRWNIESAYVRLGGEANRPVGWDHDWL